jgi:hypothetical protein
MGILGQGASRHLAHNQHTESLKTSGKLRIPTDWQSVRSVGPAVSAEQLMSPKQHSRVRLNFQAPCFEEVRWHIFQILVLLRPLLEVNRAFIFRRGQAQLLHDLFE